MAGSLQRQDIARADELAALLEVSRSLAFTLDAKAITGIVLEQLKTVVDYSRAAITVVEDDNVTILDGRPGGLAGMRIPISAGEAIWDRLIGPDALVVNDLSDDNDSLAVSLTAMFTRAGVAPAQPAPVRSWMNVPLIGRSGVVGGLVITHVEAGFLTADRIEIAKAFAGHAAVAIENARLFSELEQRTRELAALADISRSVSSSLDLGTVVDTILDQLKTVVACHAASVTVVEGESATLLALHRGDVRMKLPAGTVPLRDMPSGERIVRTAQPLLLRDTDTDEAMSRWLRHGTERLSADMSSVRCFLGVPLIVRDEVIGWVSIGHDEVGHFTEQDVDLTQAFANQVAIAISNARFHEQSQQLVVVEERQRIARDLHDSVSQALYSILLTSSAARTLVDTRPDAVADPLDTVVSLAEGGLAEMRALIFELRPESLEQEGLVVAIEKRAAALKARHSLEVALSLCEEPEASLEVKEALSRIAQEALHNVVKHAEATRIHVTLAQVDSDLILTVRDDGKGFETDGEFPGHLGLRSMQERADRVAGEIAIVSRPGEGCAISVRVPTRQA